MQQKQLTASRLRARLHYDPDTGVFRWRDRAASTVPAGSVAGYVSVAKKGYIKINVDGQAYFAHRLAWLYVYGAFPIEQIDHINRRGGDNRIDNLRLATQSQNLANTKRRRDNRSGYRGVFQRSENRWQAKIQRRSLGSFATPEDAARAYEVEARRLYGEEFFLSSGPLSLTAPSEPCTDDADHGHHESGNNHPQ